MELRSVLKLVLFLLEIYSVFCGSDNKVSHAGLAVTNFTADSLTVRWGHPGAAQLCWRTVTWYDSDPECQEPASDLTSYTIQITDICEDYNITLTWTNGSSSSLKFSALQSRFIGGPGPPRDFKGARYSAGTGRFEWGPPLPPGNYCIDHYNLQVVGGDVIGEHLPFFTRNHDVSHLPVCAQLNISLTAYTRLDNSSLPVYLALERREAAPGAVTSLAVSCSQSRSLHLNWRNPEKADCIRKYLVCWRLLGEAEESCEVLAGTVNDFLSFQVTRLSKCTEYQLRVIAVGGTNLQGISPILSYSTGPEPVANLKVDKFDVHEAVVSWQASACAELYSVCWGAWSGRGTHYCVNTTSTSAIVTALQDIDKGDNYTVIVVAIGPKGSASDIRTLKLQLLDPLENVTVADLSSESITVAWKLPTRPRVAVQQVELCWMPSGALDDKDKSCVLLPDSLSTFSIDGLQPCRWYNVSASSAHADGGRSEPRTFTRFTAPSNSSAVGGLAYLVADFYGSSLHARWEFLEGCASAVNLTWEPATNKTNHRVYPSFFTDDVTIDGFEFCSSYNITATALLSNGSEVDSKTTSINSGAGQVRNITTTSVGPGSVHMTWLPPSPGEDCVKSYGLEYSLRLDQLPGNATEYTMTGLSPCSYDMMILIVMPSLSSHPTPVFVYTSVGLAVPGPVRDVTFVARSHAIQVSWRIPTENSNCLKKYSVCWNEVNTTTELCTTVSPMLYPRYTIEGLKSCTEYTISVAAMGGNATGNRTGFSKFTGPEAVSGMELRQIGPEAVGTRWTGSSCTLLYSVCWGPWSGLGSHSCVNLTDSKATFSDLEDLSSGGRYTVIVTAISHNDSTSDPVSVTLANRCPVSILSVDNPSPESILISWELPEECQGDLNHFELCWGLTPDGKVDCTHISPDTSNFELLHLMPCAWYNVTVSAVYVDGSTSELRSGLQFTSVKDDEDPFPPTSSTTDMSTAGIMLKWWFSSESLICAKHVLVCWISSRRPVTEQCQKVDSYQNSFLIKDFKFCSNYSFSIFMLGADDRRSTKEATSVVLGPGPVRNVVARSPSPGTVLMTWEPPLPGDDCVDHYRIGAGWWMEPIAENIPANVTEYLITDQPLCTFSEYVLQAFSPTGDPSNPSKVYVSSGMGAPGEIVDLKAAFVDSDAIHLQWSTPEVFYDCLKKYSVCWREEDTTNETCRIQKVVPYPLHTISGLKSCTKYHVNVSSQGEEMRGTASQLRVLTGPDPVSNLRVVSIYGSAILMWEPQPCASKYYVCWGKWTGRGNRTCTATVLHFITFEEMMGMLANDRYTVIVRALTNFLTTSSQAMITLTGLEALENLRVTDHSPESISVAWAPSNSSSDEVDHLELCYKKLRSSDEENCTRLSSTLTSYTVEGIDSCYYYNITVAAVSAVGVQSQRASVLQFVEGLDSNGTGEIVEVSEGDAFDLRSVEVSWSLANSSCNSLTRVCWALSNEDAEDEKCEDVPSYVTEKVIPHLELCSNYSVSVAAGEESERTTITIDTVCQIPVKELELTLKEVNATEAVVVWDYTSSEGLSVDHFSVCLTFNASDSQECQQVNASESSVSLSRLHPCSGYEVSISALGDAGVTLARGTLELFTRGVDDEDYDGENAVSGFVVSNITSNSIAFKWDGLLNKTCIRKYVIQTYYFGDEIDSTDVPNNTYSFIAEDAPPCILLFFSIRAVLPDGSFTAKSKLKTDSGTQAPGKVEDIGILSTSSRSIHIVWRPPTENEMCLVRYLVCWRKEDSQTQNCSELTHSDYNAYTIAGLEPCTTYNISVAAVGSEKDVGDVNYIQWSTGPGPVRALAAKGGEPHQVTLSWEASECALGYSVCWGAWTDMGAHSCGNTTLTTYTISGLKESITYSIIVEAEIESGQRSDVSALIWNGTVPVPHHGPVSSIIHEINKTVDDTIGVVKDVVSTLGLRMQLT